MPEKLGIVMVLLIFRDLNGFEYRITDKNAYSHRSTYSSADRGTSIISHTPMARFGKPEDLTGVCLWLASDASKFVSGIVVPIDGGFSAFSGV